MFVVKTSAPFWVVRGPYEVWEAAEKAAAEAATALLELAGGKPGTAVAIERNPPEGRSWSADHCIATWHDGIRTS